MTPRATSLSYASTTVNGLAPAGLAELADRRNARALRQLAVTGQLRDALDDLVDERDSGGARELEHQVTMMTPVATSATAMATLNASRRERCARNPRSELPNSAQTAIHGRLILTIIPMR